MQQRPATLLRNIFELNYVQVRVGFFSCNAGPHLSTLLGMVSDFLPTNFQQRFPLIFPRPEDVKSVALAQRGNLGAAVPQLQYREETAVLGGSFYA